MISRDASTLPPELLMSFVRRTDVICDFLDVTCSPDASFVDVLDDWLCGHGFGIKFKREGSTGYFLKGDGASSGGLLKVDSQFNFHRSSASGGFLAVLRVAGLYRDFINVLGSVPHKVTRLDAALDVAVDAPLVLSALCSVYGGAYHFGRKALRTKTIFETRLSDEALTGTWYAGHMSRARVSCRVYDKQQERLFHGIVTPPQTRYEITFRKDYGASLWDALMPKSIFYSHSSGLIDPPSEGFDQWDSRGLVPWVSEPVDTDLTLAKFTGFVAHSDELRYIAEKGAKFGSVGKALVLQRMSDLYDNFVSEGVTGGLDGDSKGL